MIGLILFCIAVLIIGAIAVYILWRLVQIMNRKADPPPGGGGYTNITSLDYSGYVPPKNGPITFPEFRFQSGMAMAKDGTTDNPLGSGYIVIERSTNMVDWVPVCTNMAISGYHDLADTNPAAPAVFYRQYIHFP